METEMMLRLISSSFPFPSPHPPPFVPSGGRRYAGRTKGGCGKVIWHRLTLDLWLAKDNRFLNPKSSYGRILMAPSCRFIWLGSSPPCSYHLCSRMLVPGSLVTSLTLHSHPRSRGERSGSERSEKERNEPREMGCEGSMSVARCGGRVTYVLS